MIVPGSTSFPAMASLGRRSLPAPRSCALFTCVVPDSDPDHDPDRAFFFSIRFLLFYFLAFLPISLTAHHHVRSSPLPFRLNATARPASLFTHYAWFLAHMSVWFTLSLACICLLCSFFLVAQPIPSLPLFPIPFSASEHLCLCAVRQGLPLAFLLRRTRGLISIHYAAGVPCASPATRHPIAGLVPPKSPPPPPVPPLIARGWLGPRWVPETHKDKWHERVFRQYT